MKNKIKTILIIFIIGLILSILISPLRSGVVSPWGISGFQLSSIVGFFIYFLSVVFFLRRYGKALSDTCILMSFALGVSIISLVIHILNFPETKVSLLELLIHLSSIVLSYLFYIITNKYLKIFTFILSVIFSFWISTIGYDLWLYKLSFGTFPWKVESGIDGANLLMQNVKGDSLTLSHFKGRYLLLDCWNSGCGICYEEMPKVQRLYDKYKDCAMVQVYTLHARMENKNEIYSTGAEILKKSGYTLPSLSISIKDSNLKELGVNFYPTILIFDKDSKLIFRGNIESASRFIDKLMDEETEKS